MAHVIPGPKKGFLFPYLGVFVCTYTLVILGPKKQTKRPVYKMAFGPKDLKDMSPSGAVGLQFPRGPSTNTEHT